MLFDLIRLMPRMLRSMIPRLRKMSSMRISEARRAFSITAIAGIFKALKKASPTPRKRERVNFLRFFTPQN